MADNGGGHQATDEKHQVELIKQQLLPSMSKSIEAAPTRLNKSAEESRCCIFRVPQGLAGEFAEACRPRIISIGPYHHGEMQLQMLEGHKWRYLHTMLDRIQPHGIRLENLIDVVAPTEKKIRQCYSESTNNFSGPELVQMMVLDGCFIIEFLRHLAGSVKHNDILRTNLFMSVSLGRDFLRLENQVPYSVLEDLFEVTNVPKGDRSLTDLAFHLFSCFGERIVNVQERQINLKGAHLLDLFRLSLLPSDQHDKKVDESPPVCTIRSASELRRVGIRFKNMEGSTFLEIKLDRKRRTIEIPAIALDDDDLDWMLTNMVAFEQCSGEMDGHIITAYAMFMGGLIRTAEDVQLLRDCKVISNQSMTNEDFARFFSDICNDTSFDINGSYLASHYAI